jgi:hypothetical protein
MIAPLRDLVTITGGGSRRQRAYLSFTHLAKPHRLHARVVSASGPGNYTCPDQANYIHRCEDQNRIRVGDAGDAVVGRGLRELR